MSNKEKRYIKLSSRNMDRVSGAKRFPWLNICSLWLLDAGFEIGETLEVTLEENAIIISKPNKLNEPQKQNLANENDLTKREAV